MEERIKQRYVFLKEDINELYQRYRQKCHLPDVTDPVEQVQIISERQFITTLKKQIEDPKERFGVVEARLKSLIDRMM